MSSAIGLDSRRAYALDAEAIIYGFVGAGEGRAAETRDGSARVLTTSLNRQDMFKVVLYGQSSDAAGEYEVQVAHVDRGGTIGMGTDWATVATLTADGEQVFEVGLTGLQVEALVKAAADPAIEGDVRAVAVRVNTDGEAGTVTIALQHG